MISVSVKEKELFYRQYMRSCAGKDVPDFDTWLVRVLIRREVRRMRKARGDDPCYCRYCKSNFRDKGYARTKDHIVPLSKGGYNREENLVHACQDCNEWKSNRTLRCWMDELLSAFYGEERRERYGYTKGEIGIMISSVEQLIEYVDRYHQKLGNVKIIN